MLILATLMWLATHYAPFYVWPHPPWNRVGLMLIGLGLSIDLWSLFLFFRAKTTINPMKPANSGMLVSHGMYRISRNPMYLGLLLLLSGWAIYLGDTVTFIGPPLLVYILNRQQILPEERILEHIFGEQYRQYCRRVRRWL